MAISRRAKRVPNAETTTALCPFARMRVELDITCPTTLRTCGWAWRRRLGREGSGLLKNNRAPDPPREQPLDRVQLLTTTEFVADADRDAFHD